jgi:uncharacterized membrane protein YidH (DUF202 family)
LPVDETRRSVTVGPIGGIGRREPREGNHGAGEFARGVVLIGTGILIAVYGTVLFRFTPAATGFGPDFLAPMNLTVGQDSAVAVLVSFAVGGIGPMVLYGLIRFGVYIAGGVLYARIPGGDQTDTPVSVVQRFNLVLFAILFAISVLAQRTSFDLRPRVLR